MSHSDDDRSVDVLLRRIGENNTWTLSGVSRPDMRAVIACVVMELTDNGLLKDNWRDALREIDNRDPDLNT